MSEKESAISPKSSSALPVGMNAKLLDGFADALGRVVADLRREWVKDLERMDAERRAITAEMKHDVATLTASLKAIADQQIARVEERLANVKDGAPGKDGKDGAPGKDGEPGKDGADGKDGTDGKDGQTGPQGLPGEPGAPGEAGPQGDKGEPGDAGQQGTAGKDADPEVIAEIVSEAVAKAVTEIVIPKGDRGEKGDTGEPGPIGKDGASLINLTIDRDGRLQATLTDGATRDLGVVIGKDGVDGKDGKDGTPGRDGKGFSGVTSFSLDKDGRTLIVKHKDGESETEERVTLPHPLDRGVFKEGTSYQKGDSVSWGGSMFIAQRETTDKPETSDAWRLAVKRGRDGKDGIMKPPREPKPVKVG